MRAGVRATLSIALIAVQAVPAAAQTPDADMLTRLAREGARMSGQVIGMATGYCQLSPAVLFPPALLARYEARAARQCAADPDYAADFAAGRREHPVQDLYQVLRQQNPALAEQSRLHACQDLRNSMGAETGG